MTPPLARCVGVVSTVAINKNVWGLADKPQEPKCGQNYCFWPYPRVRKNAICNKWDGTKEAFSGNSKVERKGVSSVRMRACERGCIWFAPEKVRNRWSDQKRKDKKKETLVERNRRARIEMIRKIWKVRTNTKLCEFGWRRKVLRILLKGKRAVTKKYETKPGTEVRNLLTEKKEKKKWRKIKVKKPEHGKEVNEADILTIKGRRWIKWIIGKVMKSRRLGVKYKMGMKKEKYNERNICKKNKESHNQLTEVN